MGVRCGQEMEMIQQVSIWLFLFFNLPLSFIHDSLMLGRSERVVKITGERLPFTQQHCPLVADSKKKTIEDLLELTFVFIVFKTLHCKMKKE